MEAKPPERDAAAIRFPPPLIFLGFLLLGPLIDRWLDLPPLPLPWWIGAVVTVAGAVLIGVAVGALRTSGEDPQPWTSTGQVIATGLYARSRNPMYLGMAIMEFGLALAVGSVIGALLTPVAMAVVSSTVIAREEAYLTAKFGERCKDYLACVRRWL